MKITEQDLRRQYDSLETEELLALSREGGLTELAMTVLKLVLDERSQVAVEPGVRGHAEDLRSRRVIPLLAPLVKEATRFDLSPSAAAVPPSLSSKFGGQPYLAQGEHWPSCGSCRSSLTFICQFNCENVEHDDRDPTLYSFYYCFTCSPWGSEGEIEGLWRMRRHTAPSLSKAAVAVASPAPLVQATPCFARPQRVLVLPDWEAAPTVCSEVFDLCCALAEDDPSELYASAAKECGALNDSTTLLGGYPLWIQNEESARCPHCRRSMAFFAQIDSQGDHGVTWGDSGRVYLFQCECHLDVFRMRLQCY